MMVWRDVCKMGGGYGLQALCMLGDVLNDWMGLYASSDACLIDSVMS